MRTALTTGLVLLFLSLQAQSISEWHTFRSGGGGAFVKTIKRFGENTALWFDANCDSIMMDSIAFLYITPIPPSFYSFSQSSQAYFVVLDSAQKPLIQLQFSAGKSIHTHSVEITESGDYLLTYMIYDDTVYLNNSILIADTTLKEGALCLTKVLANGDIAFTRYFPCVYVSEAFILQLSNGNIALAGDVNESDIIFDDYLLECIGCHVEDSDIYVAMLDSNGHTLNAKRFGGFRYDYCWDAMVSSQGDIYLSGSFESNFDCDSLHLDNYLSWGTIDAFLLKLNANLEAMWIKHAGSANTEYGRVLTQDTEGNIYWGCEFGGEKVFFEGDTLQGGNANAFLCKMNEAGEVLWKKVFTSSDGFILRIAGISIGNDGTLWVALEFNGTLFFEDDTLPGFGKTDFVLLQLDNEGNFLQNYLVGSAGGEYCNGFQILNDHRLFVSGTAFIDDVDSFQFLNMTLHNWPNFGRPDFYFILDLSTVGTSEPPGQPDGVPLWMYPSPVSSILNIDFQSDSDEAQGLLSVYDSQGRLCIQKNIAVLRGHNNLTLEVAQLPAGLYHLQLTDNKNRPVGSARFSKL
jgi:hypothetical protein